MDKNNYHETGLQKIVAAVIRYECCYCHKQFTTLSGCATHIEDESILGFANPNDIKITILKEEQS